MGYPQDAQGLTAEERELLKEVKIIRVIAEEDYGEADKVRLPYFDYAERLLGYAGHKVVESDGKIYDATLHIRTREKPIGADYFP